MFKKLFLTSLFIVSSLCAINAHALEKCPDVYYGITKNLDHIFRVNKNNIDELYVFTGRPVISTFDFVFVQNLETKELIAFGARDAEPNCGYPMHQLSKYKNLETSLNEHKETVLSANHFYRIVGPVPTTHPKPENNPVRVLESCAP